MAEPGCWDLYLSGRCDLSRHLRVFAPRARGSRLLWLAELGLSLERGLLGPIPGLVAGPMPLGPPGAGRFRVRATACPALLRIIGSEISSDEVRRLGSLGLAALMGRIRVGGSSLGQPDAALGQRTWPVTPEKVRSDDTTQSSLNSVVAQKASSLLMSF